jgi:hypothetical protein
MSLDGQTIQQLDYYQSPVMICLLKSEMTNMRQPSVQILGSPYVRSHSQSPRGRGSWIFSRFENINFLVHMQNVDYFVFNDTYTVARAAATEWARENGYTHIYVMP